MESLGVIDPAFWRGRRVFVTGHTGFKGSWLSHWLVLLGASVRGYSLEPMTTPSLFTVLRLASNLDHTTGDVRDFDNLGRAMREFGPEIVFHLAAQPLVRRSYREPKLTYETNVLGTLNLYEAVRTCESVRAVVSITTDKCYENKEWIWGYKETDAMGGYDPYSSSKACVELLSAAYRRSFFVPEEHGGTHRVALATARAGNVIGGGDWAPDRLVPDCINALAAGKVIVVRNPQAVRPWQHVLEPLSGYLVLSQRLCADGARFSEGWNFGPNPLEVTTVEEVVRQVIGCWGKGKYTIEPGRHLHESHMLKLDIQKAATMLEWKPIYSEPVAVKKTVEWYLGYYTNSDPLGLATRQCTEYLRDSMRQKPEVMP